MPNKDRSKLSILIPQVRHSTTYRVPLLPNGSEIQLKDETVVMKHTCAFDSLVSVFGATYIDIPIMRDKFESSSDKFANFIKSLLHQKFDKKMEIARFELLKEIFPDKKAIKKVGKLTSFACDVSIGGLYTSLCTSNADVMSSRKRTQKCTTCRFEDTTDAPFVNHTGKFDFKQIQKSIETERIRVCETCLQKTMVVEDQFNELVVIDCESLDQINKQTTIDDIENEISLNEDEYELFAAIEYNPYLLHFIPHIKRITKKWETYDDLNIVKDDTYTDEDMYIFMLFYKRKTSGMYLV